MPIDAALDGRLGDGDYRLLGILLHQYGRDKDHCWQSEETLAKELAQGVAKRGDIDARSKPQVSVRTVQRRLAALVSASYITIIRPDDLSKLGYQHTTKSNTYQLTETVTDKFG